MSRRDAVDSDASFRCAAAIFRALPIFAYAAASQAATRPSANTSAPSPSLLTVFKEPFSPTPHRAVTGRGRRLNAARDVLR